jgi:hypothetical protein
LQGRYYSDGSFGFASQAALMLQKVCQVAILGGGFIGATFVERCHSVAAQQNPESRAVLPENWQCG